MDSDDEDDSDEDDDDDECVLFFKHICEPTTSYCYI